MKVHSGPFHPELEDAFVETARLHSAPFTPIAVITPSSRLRDRAQLLLAERLPPMAGVHFHTLSSLADALVWESGGLKTNETVVSDSLFFDTLVKLILRSDRPFIGLDDLAVPEGFPPSVRSTLRDLMDAGVNPEDLLAAVNEREEFNIPEVDAGTLKQLIHLLRLYLSRIKTMKVAPRARIVQEAARLAPESAWLRSFKSVLFYGFYDLTGLQAALFEAVVRAHPDTHFFFPYFHQHPDNLFASRFREDVLHKIPHDEVFLVEADAEAALHRREGRLDLAADGIFPRVVRWDDFEARVINVSGLRDEAWMVASEILRLHAAGVAFTDIAVVARLRERLIEFGPVLAERGIPFVTSEKPTLVDAPQIAVALELLASTAAGAVALSKDLLLNPDVKASETPVAPPRWKGTAPWKSHVAWVESVLSMWIQPASDGSARVWKALRSELRKLSDFDRLGEDVGWDDFSHALRGRWQQAPAPSPGSGLGVSLIHAEASRGLPFDVVFLAGLEERVFPRVIREDPFLRDPARRVIFNTLGNKIGQKMTALEEERLLLHLIARSAKRKLYVSYQRSDDEGKIVGASSFLRRLTEEWGVSLEDTANVVPRRLTDRLASVPPELLSRGDLFSGLLIAERDAEAVALSKATGGDDARLRRALTMQRALDDFGDAGPYDGIVGPAAGERFLAARGLSASGLETFARCPFQFFVRYVLRVSPPEEVVSPEEIEVREKGTLVHAVLENFYGACLANFGATWPATPPEKLFNAAFDAVFAERPPEIYPILWEALRDRLKVQMLSFLSADFASLHSRGLVPSFFERQHATTTLDPALEGVRFQGIMDRVDVGSDRARVVDYKTGRRYGAAIPMKVVRGLNAQPTLYMIMAAEFLKAEGRAVDVDFAYLHVAEEEPITEFTAEDFKRNRESTLDTLKAEVGMMRGGMFAIQPGDHCERCDAASICRKNDSMSRYRAEGSLEPLRALQKKKPGKDA